MYIKNIDEKEKGEGESIEFEGKDI